MILSVLTVNLRRETSEDGEDNWPFRKHRTARLIEEYHPDLFGTQEGRRPQIRQLQELVPDYSSAEDHRDWDPERMYPCLFYRAGSFRVTGGGDFWLSETPLRHASKSWNSAFPRLATWALLESTEETKRLFCCVTHLDHLSAPARSGQSRTLLDELTKRIPEDTPVLLMGDFNDVPGSAPYVNLTGPQAGFRDAWTESKKSEKSTWHGFTGIGDRGRIDWILLKGRVQVLDIKIIENTYDERYPSDHFPVFATVRL